MSSPADALPAPAPPKLQRPRRIDDPRRLAQVVAPSIEAALGDHPALLSHRQLAERCEAARAEVRELEGALRQAADQDARNEARFARDPQAKLQPAKAAKARERLDEARRQLAALEARLRPSADELFAAALEHVEATAEALDKRLAEHDERAVRLVEEALSLLDERAGAVREATWLAQCQWEPSVMPYQRSTTAVANSRGAVELRGALAALRHDREEAHRRRLEAAVEIEMLFEGPRRPKPPIPPHQRQEARREAEQRVRARLAAS